MASATPTPTIFNFTAAKAFAVAAGEEVTQLASGTSSASVRSTSTASSSSITKASSQGTSQTTTSAAPSANTSVPALADRKTLPTGAIVGIVIPICSLVLGGVLLLVLLRRRRRRRRQNADLTTPYPVHVFSTSVSTHSYPTANRSAPSISKVRRQYLQNELRATQEKIVEIQHLDRDGSTGVPQASTPNANQVPTRGGSNPGTESVEAISELRERNEALTARIRELEAHMESPWALGLSDEPPPGYSEEQR
ncbi:hypothetical protein MVEN_00359900 [Mycena venus]|uniref:Mid2 domain-containing protein n=1 Tax=Mycena venus TaxID=2733690 RepID=A0A8H6YUI6_9AGAR|nr:hypothetical protein MVEN_00359900 [Mycena venus]